jgi:hypothetical protein
MPPGASAACGGGQIQRVRPGSLLTLLDIWVGGTRIGAPAGDLLRRRLPLLPQRGRSLGGGGCRGPARGARRAALGRGRVGWVIPSQPAPGGGRRATGAGAYRRETRGRGHRGAAQRLQGRGGAWKMGRRAGSRGDGVAARQMCVGAESRGAWAQPRRSGRRLHTPRPRGGASAAHTAAAAAGRWRGARRAAQGESTKVGRAQGAGRLHCRQPRHGGCRGCDKKRGWVAMRAGPGGVGPPRQPAAEWVQGATSGQGCAQGASTTAGPGGGSQLRWPFSSGATARGRRGRCIWTRCLRRGAPLPSRRGASAHRRCGIAIVL